MDGIGAWAAQAPDAPASISTDGVITFAETEERQRRIAGYLRSLGCRRGDMIAIHSRNRFEVIETVAAASRAGITPVMVNPLLTPPEVSYILTDSGASILFTDRVLDLDVPMGTVTTFGAALDRALDEATPLDLPSVTACRPMHYTSGTTGRPKGVYVEPLDEEEALRVSIRFRKMWDLRADDRHLVCSPLAHSAPLRYSLRTLESGGAVIVPSKFEAEEALATIDLFRTTSTFMVPTHLERIVALGQKKISSFDLSSMRLLCHAGAPIREITKRAVIDMFPEGSVWEFYGSTEGQATRISAPEWLQKPGSVGQAHPGAWVYAMSDDFAKKPPGEVGRIWVRDEEAEPWVYWNDEPKTEAAWREGAFTVNDVGYLDTDGYLFLVGRENDTIISGGVNVYPQEVEAVLGAHEDIAEVVVYGVPDDEWGQRVCARIVLRPGAELDAETLKSWAREQLAAFKVPRVVEFVESLEHSPTGKVKRPRPS